MIEQRCTVCHGCYDAPCQLKLTSTDGIDRGASTEKIYRAYRILADKPHRLGIDEWHQAFDLMWQKQAIKILLSP